MMKNNFVRIRRAVLADAPGLREYVATLFAERLPVLFLRDAAPTLEQERDFIREMLSTPRRLLLVAEEEEGKIVGMLDFHGHRQAQQSHAGEFGMSVAREWRGRGIGRRLLDELLKWAPSAAIERIELRVFSNNTPAIKLYGAAGFVVEGRQVDAVQVGDEYVDIVFMAKLLSHP